MYCENTSDINREFCNALALLRSTEQDSTEKLRQMLDSCIEKRYGPGSTLITRIPKRFLQDMDDSIVPIGASKKRLNVRAQDATKNEICDGFQQIVSLSQANDISDRSTTINMRVLEVGYVNCYDDGDIPRISIPDEGSTDTTVCKICNGAKLGPLILLECQECQETYHPLCHQPPVVDVDVYDPRFVWRCRRCTEATTEISVRCKTMEKKSAEEIGQNDDTTRENLNIPRLKMNGRTDVDLFGKNDPSEVENRNTQLHDTPLFVKNLTNPSQRKGNFLSATTQSRKRIGSKLIVTRATIK